MMLILGLFIIPFSIILIKLHNDIKTTDKKKALINLSIFLLSILFIFVTFMVNMDPFKFEIQGGFDYYVYSLIIFLFTPFLWIHLFFHTKFFFSHLRIKKNSKVKDKITYKYYRDDLNKISPSVMMFTNNFSIDYKKAIASTILKLKLTKNLIENKNNFKIISDDKLLNSEKMVINLIDNKDFDKDKYSSEVINEAINLGFVKKHRGNMLYKLFKLLMTLAIPTAILILSIKFDSYVFNNYKTYLKDGVRYVLVEDKIGNIHFDHPDNINDYYHGHVNERNIDFYDKSLVRSTKLSNPVVKKTMLLHTADGILFIFSSLLIVIAIYKFIDQLRFINKGYRRTIKGSELLNKSYALKNFLKDFSTIDAKTEEELILWEYYLVYATALGINIKINDKLINKYVN